MLSASNNQTGNVWVQERGLKRYMVYRDMDPREVLIEVIGDIGEAEVRLRRAEAKLIESGLLGSRVNRA